MMCDMVNRKAKRLAKRFIPFYLFTFLLLSMTSCFGSKMMSASGGEVTGTGGRAFTEPTPYGMVLVKRGHLKMGIENQDSLWGKKTPLRDISVDGFWMDETEVTNSKYRQFVNYVRDSILRERLAEFDETYKTVKTDKDGEEIGSVLNWKKPLPRRPNEDEQEIIDAMYVTNPVTGDKMLDYRQLNYRYEVYDYASAALRRNRVNPQERNLNTDITVDPNEQVWISKDTAYVDDDGNIVDEDEVLANLHASSPASADRYLNNPEATAERWYYDENGMKWGVTGDIAVRHADGSYTIMGRASDSYIDKHGKRVYLFMIESTLDENDPINEWEISAFKNGKGGYDVVGQIILDPRQAEPDAELVEYICDKYKLDAVKFYKEFEIGEITAKRDYILLTHDYEGYYAPYDSKHLMLVNYSESGDDVRIVVKKKDVEIEINEKVNKEEQ